MKPIVPADARRDSVSEKQFASSKSRPTVCQEVEVKGRDTGSLGGVGKHCTEAATAFCSTCSKMLCKAHYDRIHSIHDVFGTEPQNLTAR